MIHIHLIYSNMGISVVMDHYLAHCFRYLVEEMKKRAGFQLVSEVTNFFVQI